jgi:hypothetical protein
MAAASFKFFMLISQSSFLSFAFLRALLAVFVKAHEESSQMSHGLRLWALRRLDAHPDREELTPP